MPINKIQFQPGLSLPGFFERFGTEAQCAAALEQARWPNGFVCPDCGLAEQRSRVGHEKVRNALGVSGYGHLRLVQRGNGAPTAELPAVNATADFALAEWVRWLDGEGPVPALLAVAQYDLGTVAGVPLGFTNAAALASGAVVFLAGAEASPDAVQDGPRGKPSDKGVAPLGKYLIAPMCCGRLVCRRYLPDIRQAGIACKPLFSFPQLLTLRGTCNTFVGRLGPVAGFRVALIERDDVWIWEIVDERGEPVRLKLRSPDLWEFPVTLVQKNVVPAHGHHGGG